MADSKISQLTELTTPVAEDLVPIVDDPNGTPINKFIRLKNLFGNASNTNITGTLTVSGGNTNISGSNTVISSNVNITGTTNVANLHVSDVKLVIQTSKTPSTNNATTELGSPTSDWDANYLYVAVSNTVIKRVPLQVF
jgi:hypothetical protein